MTKLMKWSHDELSPPKLRPNRPMPLQSNLLDTAQWNDFFKYGEHFQWGDFYLSRNMDGDPIGVGDDSHVLLEGGTRGGKGVSVLIPNLCLWQGSAVVIDPKGENATVTARRRGNGSAYSLAMGQKVCVMDPFGVAGRADDDLSDLRMCYNPIDRIRIDNPHAIDDAAKLANSLLIVEDQKEQSNFWVDQVRFLLKALILHIGTSPVLQDDQRNLLTLREYILSGDQFMRQIALETAKEDEVVPSAYQFLFEGMRRNDAFGGLISRAADNFSYMEKTSARTFTGVISYCATHTEFLDSPEIQYIVSKSDFDLSELKTSRRGVSLYLCLPEGKMSSYARWLRMMIDLTITNMEQIKGQPRSGMPVLMVLDEFAQLGKMTFIKKAAAQIAGFGIKLVFSVQSLVQLKDTYGSEGWEIFMANTSTKVAFTIDDYFSRDYLTKLIGDREIIKTVTTTSSSTGTSKTQSKGGNMSWTVNQSTSQSKGGSWGPGVFNSNKNWNNGSSQGESLTEGGNYSNSTSTNQSHTTGTSQSIHKRPLVTVGEMGRDFGKREDPKALVIMSGEQPVRLNRLPYYMDPEFDGLYDPHPDHPTPRTIVENCLLRALQKNHEQLQDIIHTEEMRQHKEYLEKQTWEQTCREEDQRNFMLEEAEKLKKRKARLRKIKITAGIFTATIACYLISAFGIYWDSYHRPFLNVAVNYPFGDWELIWDGFIKGGMILSLFSAPLWMILSIYYFKDYDGRYSYQHLLDRLNRLNPRQW